MKKISICIPCYNEEGNVYNMYMAITNEMKKMDYDYEIIFSDNDSLDKTQEILRDIALKDKHVKAIFNMRNFGPERSGWNCYLHATGDVVVSFPCDFQVPPEYMEEYLELWEAGNLIVCSQKNKSEENFFIFLLRNIYYKIMRLFSDVHAYERLNGMVVFDKVIIETLKKAYEPGNNIIFLCSELGYKIKTVPFEQRKRRSGKSSYNVIKYFDYAVTSMINTSYVPLRIATCFGALSSAICFIVGIIYLIYKLWCWDSFDAGMAPVLIGMFFIGSVQLLFIGIIGEYIGSILRKISRHPLVVERELINFDE